RQIDLKQTAAYWTEMPIDNPTNYRLNSVRFDRYWCSETDNAPTRCNEGSYWCNEKHQKEPSLCKALNL
ncbi:hypothetical protein LZT04_09490, partial [Vibrio fluvialis]|nr:hypothetical protein [Vibrio fluvialis]